MHGVVHALCFTVHPMAYCHNHLHNDNHDYIYDYNYLVRNTIITMMICTLPQNT